MIDKRSNNKPLDFQVMLQQLENILSRSEAVIRNGCNVQLMILFCSHELFPWN